MRGVKEGRKEGGKQPSPHPPATGAAALLSGENARLGRLLVSTTIPRRRLQCPLLSGTSPHDVCVCIRPPSGRDVCLPRPTPVLCSVVTPGPLWPSSSMPPGNASKRSSSARRAVGGRADQHMGGENRSTSTAAKRLSRKPPCPVSPPTVVKVPANFCLVSQPPVPRRTRLNAQLPVD